MYIVVDLPLGQFAVTLPPEYIRVTANVKNVVTI
jgi:hypothetical protein